MNEKFFDLKKEKQDRMINASLKVFAEPFHCFQILPHGFHGKRVRLLSGGQLVDLPLPCLRGYPLAAVFQFFQIPGRCVIQNQFPAVALFKLFPLFPRYVLGDFNPSLAVPADLSGIERIQIGMLALALRILAATSVL